MHIICSDLTDFPVARACAASSAVPIVLTPIILKNYAGSCGYRMPPLLELAMRTGVASSRQFDLANDIDPYLTGNRILTGSSWPEASPTTSAEGESWIG